MQRKKVSSSNIKSIGWENGTLEVEFHSGGVYQYTTVGEEIWIAFMESESKGKYFHQYIKGQFEHKKLDPIPTQTLMDLNLPEEVVKILQDAALKWVHLYNREEEDAKSCCRQTARAWIKYFFDIKRGT